MPLLRKRYPPIVMRERPTGARRTRIAAHLFGLVRRSVDEEEVVADIVTGGSGFVDTDTVTYWRKLA